MRPILLALMGLFFVMGTNLSCGKKEDGDLVVRVTPNESFILPVAIDKCDEPGKRGLAASSVKFRELSIEWKGPQTLEVVLIKVQFSSGALQGGSKTISIGSTELEAMFGSTVITGPGTITSNVCGLSLGGLSFSPTAGDSPVSVQVEVTAVATEENGDSFPVYSSSSATANYISPN